MEDVKIKVELRTKRLLTCLARTYLSRDKWVRR